MKRTVVTVTSGATTNNATEQVIATIPCPPLGDNPLISGVVVDGVVDITPGTAATSVTVKCRRGTTTSGTQIGATLTVPSAAAGVLGTRAISFQDTAPTGSPYVITQTAAAQTGAGTVNSLVVTATAS
jgi:hypothetical protein